MVGALVGRLRIKPAPGSSAHPGATKLKKTPKTSTTSKKKTMIQESSPPLIFNASADRDPLAIVSTHGPSQQNLGELQLVVITFFP